MKNEIMIIFPQDQTTDFLQTIPDLLFEKHGEGRFHYKRIGFSHPEHTKCRQSVEELPDDSFVLFLGHGRRDALLGAFDYERFDFIRQEHLHIFRRKKVFFLSCHSKNFLSNQNIEGVGFDHLLTSTNDLGDEIYRRKYAYLTSAGGNDSKSVYQFSDKLAVICGASLNDLVSKSLSLSEFYKHLKIRFNKEIATLILKNNPTKVKNIANLLLAAKNEMQYFPPPNV